jgi:hypothetical protein
MGCQLSRHRLLSPSNIDEHLPPISAGACFAGTLSSIAIYQKCKRNKLKLKLKKEGEN